MSVLLEMKKKIADFSEHSAFWNRIYYTGKYSMAKIVHLLQGDKGYAKWFYRLYTGRTLNLESPERFDEKIWWLKLNNRDPKLTLCSDKNAVREYVKQCGLADILIPQFGVFENANDIDFSQYSCEVVAKCTHNSGGLFFYDPSMPVDKEKMKAAKHRLNYILRKDASVLSLEWNYKNIPHRIVVEKVIRNKDGSFPLDYKFMCFDGEPRLLFLDLGLINEDTSYNHDYPRNVYDMDFNLMPIYETRPNADYPVERPDNFKYMVEVARKLSSPFPHCRVDLYNVDGKVYFGEITFYHGGGCNNIQPEEWDYKIGSWIDLNSTKIIRGE